MNHVFIVGFMGAGKSTVGRILASMLGLPFEDLDAKIEREAGRTVGEIFDSLGEEAFRDLEEEALRSVAEGQASVVACGGGVVIRDSNRRLLKRSGAVVYLTVTAGEALARVGDVSSRPLLARGGPTAAQTLMAARESLYRAVADVTVDTVGRAPDEVAAQIAASLGSLEER